MPRIKRVAAGGEVYHVLNRANARVQIFDNKNDYQQFEEILEEAVKNSNVSLLAYCVMPNHWHIVIRPNGDGDMSLFMGWLSNTHTRRWHVTKNTVGQGHLYQGRFKSFLCAQDSHLLTVLRYVERNAKTANLVQKAEDWQWSSIWRREFGNIKEKAILSDWPMPYPDDYLELLNLPLTPSEEEKLVKAEEKNIPYGSDAWQFAVVGKYHLQQAMRERGRPKKGG